VGQTEEGLTLLAEALELVDKTGARSYEAELYRLKGELTLKQHAVPSPRAQIEAEAEACFFKAIEIARRQQAKSWKLRAATSLARLWQQQGRQADAHKLLSEVYNWFTEGLDTKDLQEAKMLLQELI
jgi:predicted ATPase